MIEAAVVAKETLWGSAGVRTTLISSVSAPPPMSAIPATRKKVLLGNRITFEAYCIGW
jgi:hypothetical protein